MATLEKIRNKAGLLVVVVGVALLAFILGDFLNSGSTFLRQNQEKVAVVDGVSINYQTYQKRIDEMMDMYKMQTGSSNMPEEYQVQMRQSVYDAMVREIVLDKELEKLGITVSSDELFDMVQGENISPLVQQMPMFLNPQTGMFDKNMMLNFLRMIDDKAIAGYPEAQQAELLAAKDYWLFWEKNIKRQRLEEKYVTLLTKAVVANKLDAQDAYDSGLESSDIVYVKQSYASVPDSAVQVSTSELENLYNQRKEQFKQKETKVVTYLTKLISPSEEDYAVAREDVDKLIEELSANEQVAEIVGEYSDVPYIDAYISAAQMDMDMREFVTSAEVGAVSNPIFESDQYRVFKLVDKTVAPDSVKFSHIMLAPTRDEAGMRQLADSLLNVLKGGGDFAAIAAEYSAGQTSENGGEVGWFTEAAAIMNLGPEYTKAIFSTPVNTVAEVNMGGLMNNGLHIIKVTERTSNVNKYKVANVQMSVTPSTATYSKLYNDLNQYITENRSKAKMDTTASAAGYEIYPNTHLTSTDHTIGGIPSSRQVVRWAFENSKGDVSDIFECQNFFVVATLEGTIPEGYRSFKSAESMIKPELLAKKKGERIIEDLKAKNLSSIDAYASAMSSSIDSVKFVSFNTSRISNVGLEPKLNAYVSALGVDQLSQPIDGNSGVYVFKVLNRTKDTAEYDEQKQIQQIEASNTYRVGYQSVQSLINKAKIEDNRIRFY